jgi:hypothetical protein
MLDFNGEVTGHGGAARHSGSAEFTMAPDACLGIFDRAERRQVCVDLACGTLISGAQDAKIERFAAAAAASRWQYLPFLTRKARQIDVGMAEWPR